MELRHVKSAERTRSKESRPCSSNTTATTASPLVDSDNFPGCNDWPRPEWVAEYNDSESSDRLSQSVTSSTSWSDEMEGELTKKVQDQWRLFENTLYKDDTDQLSSGHPLREECRLWNQHSPQLRIVGHAIKPSVGCQTRSRLEEAEEQIEEIIAAHGEYEEKTPSKTNNLQRAKEDDDLGADEDYKETVKKAVIDQIFARIWPDVVSRIEPALRQKTGETWDAITVGKCQNPEDILTGSFNSLTIGEDISSAALRNQTGGFNSMTIGDDISLVPLRSRSGRSGHSAGRGVASVPIRPLLLECPPPPPARTGSAPRLSPARLAQLRHFHPSPERLLSPLPAQAHNELRHGEIRLAPGETRPVKSAGRKAKPGDRRETRQRPQYDPMTGRMIAREETRSGLRRNLKTSPPVPWSRHGTLPPIETTEIIQKISESKCKRSTSAMFKGGRLNSSSRPNTSLNAKVKTSA